ARDVAQVAAHERQLLRSVHALDLVEAVDGLLVEEIAAEPIDGVGGVRDHLSGFERLDRSADLARLRVHRIQFQQHRGAVPISAQAAGPAAEPTGARARSGTARFAARWAPGSLRRGRGQPRPRPRSPPRAPGPCSARRAPRDAPPDRGAASQAPRTAAARAPGWRAVAELR